MIQEQQGAASAAVNETAQTRPYPDGPAVHATMERGVSSENVASMPPVARREPVARTHHGDTFLDPYAWMKDKDSAEVHDYVSAQNAYCEQHTAALGPLRDTLFNELTSRIQQTDMSVPTRMDGYWYFTRTREGAQYAVQCRLPIRGEDDWTPPDVDPMGEPGSMPGEQVVFDTNREAEGHDFFQVGGMDLSRDGRWMLYGVDTRGDERYDFRIRDLQSGTELPEVLEGIAGACITPDAQWVFYTVLDDAWRPCAVRRHKVGTPVSDDVEVFREHDERFWLGVSLSFDERTQQFGTPQLEVDCNALGKSATVPRVSPDGRYLLFTLGDYGQFHIWHKSADLYVKDLKTGQVRPLTEANSPNAESYHTWSSNGRWIVFSSRRDDGSYTRPYIAYFDTAGNAHKAFLLPQEDPEQNLLLLKSYNVPELSTDAVPYSADEFRKVIYDDTNVEQAKFIR